MNIIDTDHDKIISGLTISLTKSVLYKDSDNQKWEELMTHQSHVNAAVRILGLHLVVDATDGYAFLQTMPEHKDDDAYRVVGRRRMYFKESLLLVILRAHLAEEEAMLGQMTHYIKTSEIIQKMTPFLPKKSNEASIDKKIRELIARVVNFGFLSKARDRDDMFQIRLVIKSFITADKMQEILDSYREYANGSDVIDPDEESTEEIGEDHE